MEEKSDEQEKKKGGESVEEKKWAGKRTTLERHSGVVGRKGETEREEEVSDKWMVRIENEKPEAIETIYCVGKRFHWSRF